MSHYHQDLVLRIFEGRSISRPVVSLMMIVGKRTGLTQQRSDFAVEPNLAFGYDDLGQLTSATLPQLGGGSESFVYDPLGNRLRKDAQATDSIIGTGNRLLGDDQFTYGYDANVNLTSKTEILTLDVTTYSYDGENRLVRNWVSAKSYGNAPRHYPRTT
jgi:YD repeat-containing protein